MNENKYINVWDLLVRISHWSLLFFVLIGFLSGDEKNLIHLYAGYTVLCIVVLRVLWGFIGSRYARFNNFIYSPTEAIQYLQNLITGSPKYYVGHNPAAGWMVLILLAMLFIVCGTGHMAYQTKKLSQMTEEDTSPFPIVNYAFADSDEEADDDEKEDELWEEFHEATSYTLLVLIFFHIAGALSSSKIHNENLVRSMITGKKSVRVTN